MDDLNAQVKDIQAKFEIVGRSEQIEDLLIAYYSGKNILIEGEIGTSKTTLARAFAEYMDKDFFRVDGSEDVLSHVLVGYFDPPVVISKGYIEDAFLYGPLAKAMMNGGVLFINELNRLPESTQNVLLSALDEGFLDIPKLDPIKSHEGFITITTMNPSSFVGVSNLGEALKDRFVWIETEYQPQDEEMAITLLKLKKLLEIKQINITEIEGLNEQFLNEICKIAVLIVEYSRDHKDLRRGASIRGAIDAASIVLMNAIKSNSYKTDLNLWLRAASMALSTKIELRDASDTNFKNVIEEIVRSVLEDFR
ncbi:MAG: AAA domain-containing protein [Candidatus Lokiarchaeota archaeon]|nr:AAA domain-containing protein [Candidatus Lokiarchaeota archaeon]